MEIFDGGQWARGERVRRWPRRYQLHMKEYTHGNGELAADALE
jgi:hypothetical protein